jgi:23S rRNA (uracil1939-C5)-methyltransferase
MTRLTNLTIESVDLDAKGRAVHWHRQSFQRVAPKCPHFGICGGCAMQHIEASAQLAIKQRVLEDNLWHIGKLKAGQWLAPLDGPQWGYRTRARLTARWVDKKGGMLLGFHERKSSYVAVMDSCQILPPRVWHMLPALKDLLGSLSIARRIPQAELAVGESGMSPRERRAETVNAGQSDVIVWVLRILEPLTAHDEAKLRAFADEWQVQFWVQPGGPHTAALLYPPGAPPLMYHLPEFDLCMPFSPVDFTQVNPAINRAMVKRAIDFLGPQPGERVADFYCGLGNFSLALARTAGTVVGLEGSKALTDRAMQNAALHGLEERISFETCNLFDITPSWLARLGRFDRMLFDPPREGAQALCQSLAELHQSENAQDHALLPKRIVYVSCNPATLARDAAILVHEGGWRLRQAGIINMFPHTAHVESMAVFERG